MNDTKPSPAQAAAPSSGLDPTATLVENHRRFLEFLSRRVARPQDAEEILQEAYVRSLSRGDSIREHEASTAWFYRLLRNALVDYYRRRGAEQRLLQAARHELGGIVPAVDEELLDVVCNCIGSLLGTLKPSYADAIRQVDLGGRRVHDYAEAEGITPNNAAVRLHRAREALREKLVKTCGTCAVHGCSDCHCGSGAPCS